MVMLQKIRRVLAVIFLFFITLLFLDFTGTIHKWFGWMAKIQFLPAALALNVGVILLLILLTFLLGRVYCSVICPLGIFQDIVSWLAGKKKKNRFRYSKALTGLRWTVLALFIIVLAAGVTSAAALIAPYSAYGRIASNLFQPLYLWGNNALAALSEHMGNYWFYSADVWLKSIPTFLVAVATFLILIVLAWRGGRTYCNTICPVGTILGFIAKYAWLKPVIDTSKCISCNKCARNCKASCINVKTHTVDYSRCVACMDCINQCSENAIRYIHPKKRITVSDTGNKSEQTNDKATDNSRRNFLGTALAITTASTIKAQEKKVDGGLAVIVDKKIPERATPLTPPGALSARHFAQHCTACQLCVSVCPTGVLRPSSDLSRFMQPEMSFERGYCRPECTKCGDVCPTGAIRPITAAEKSATQIGHAVWIKANCITQTDNVDCDNCARHCPTGAIQMIPSDPNNQDSRKIPAINSERCIGCGSCENLCPARPFSAIYVEGHEVHRTI